MWIKILQSVGAGLFLALTVGFLLGLVGITSPRFVTVVILIVTYFVSGIVAGQHPEHPYLTAGISGTILVGINQAVTIGIVAPGSAELVILLYALLNGWVLSLCGSVVGRLLSRLFRRDHDHEVGGL